ncbi:hypothetical protein B0H63DRAFT_192074 [Podospora didyma]|uniref:Uncharacterized protein n=1 Tax=Podospora didyma TaxID=330526 RepID=A0AAE0NQZ0_9PEZI|nr:hypothetical protein B0H63DRAFT_192074 [Podospora didyma]
MAHFVRRSGFVWRQIWIGMSRAVFLLLYLPLKWCLSGRITPEFSSKWHCPFRLDKGGNTEVNNNHLLGMRNS